VRHRAHLHWSQLDAPEPRLERPLAKPPLRRRHGCPTSKERWAQLGEGCLERRCRTLQSQTAPSRRWTRLPWRERPPSRPNCLRPSGHRGWSGSPGRCRWTDGPLEQLPGQPDQGACSGMHRSRGLVEVDRGHPRWSGRPPPGSVGRAAGHIRALHRRDDRRQGRHLAPHGSNPSAAEDRHPSRRRGRSERREHPAFHASERREPRDRASRHPPVQGKPGDHAHLTCSMRSRARPEHKPNPRKRSTPGDDLDCPRPERST
jgi:hypothetical protein